MHLNFHSYYRTYLWNLTVRECGFLNKQVSVESIANILERDFIFIQEFQLNFCNNTVTAIVLIKCSTTPKHFLINISSLVIYLMYLWL